MSGIRWIGRRGNGVLAYRRTSVNVMVKCSTSNVLSRLQGVKFQAETNAIHVTPTNPSTYLVQHQPFEVTCDTQQTNTSKVSCREADREERIILGIMTRLYIQ
jgi:hypothetical protein